MEIDMNKKIITVLLACALVLPAAGCAKNDNAGGAPQATERTDASGAYEGAASDANPVPADGDYSEMVDMEKVEGEEASSDSDKDDFKGDLKNAEVTIEDAKVIKYEDSDVAVISLKYKNNSSEPQAFTSSVTVNAYQNGDELRPAVVTDVEGVEMLAQTQFVESGDTITVQKAFVLDDKSPMTVEAVYALDKTSYDPLVKVFNF